MRKTKKACQVCSRPFFGSVDCHYCPSCAREKKLDTVVQIRTCQDRGRRDARIAHILRVWKTPENIENPVRFAGLEQWTSAKSAAKNTWFLPAARNIVQNPARESAFLRGSASTKRAMTKDRARTQRSQSAEGRRKRSARTAFANFPAASRKICVPIFADRNRKNCSSA